MEKTKKIKDLSWGDRIVSVNSILEVINAKNGLITVYNQKTGFFYVEDLRRFFKNGSVKVL